MLFSEPKDDLIYPVEPGPRTNNKYGVHCFVALTGNYSKTVFEQASSGISKTWGNRCNSLKFTRNYEKNEWKAWWKAVLLAEISAQFGDWIVLAGIESYVVLENVRKLVERYVHSDAVREFSD